MLWILTSEDMVGHPSYFPNLLETLELLLMLHALDQSKCTIPLDSKLLPHTSYGQLFGLSLPHPTQNLSSFHYPRSLNKFQEGIS
ncbi:hypothetical protein LEP1GSC131_1642 [Leptospira kirschneri str. 200802841]|uniref:Uncharacterized protein n=1 Tax=Leptospira kirschneri str. 200802841 TaxID=1193047 RepID=A0A828XT97_9LEPT|nr:hypothetical protein LEP1GSC131_1642 [Leptospira kirschneri str. 200802841]